jgi:PadR family transcriptional regulator PadR
MTDQGLEFYKELEATWQELANAVATLTKNENKEHISTNQTTTSLSSGDDKE